METQSGARTPLVDPFGREVEEWLRDAPATRAPYLADLVVPPVTGPVQRPDAASDAAASDAAVESATAVAEPSVAEPSVVAAVTAPTSTPSDESAFRRPRDRARHAAVCAPSFPEPPERIALRLEDLAVEVSASTGRTTIERIVLLEDEVRRRDEDLARLAAWEATVAGISDPELEAARGFAHTVFADLLADAALEADRRERAAARRAATGSVAVVLPPAADSIVRPAATPVVQPTPAAPVLVEPTVVEVTDLVDASDAPGTATTPERDVPVRPVLSLPVVSPVSANTRPTPLIQPATGPTVIDRAAFAAALTAHDGATASTPVVLPEAVSVPAAASTSDRTDDGTVATEPVEPAEQPTAGWWSRFIARMLQAFGRR
ncbi:hypothetical protein DEJ28_08265 [Curtobacterium sp. MCPF17_002]|uniref:hypothetical protein n=1 Tax=Curtobacterium sp. MCPF17_002 TaxID=2175645 RepID=UPI000DA9A432|nr:hypothetical protein [Curtobacterium sp. MCPF17_002]WIB79082.1 hypothetical protein DEJ28_08265 [Curtobacterium sp. MCPF17_002]